MSLLMDSTVCDQVLVFDSSNLQKQTQLPTEFVWPHNERVNNYVDELNEPLINLRGFFKGDQEAIVHAAEQIKYACLNHGFFQVTNHGVDANLIGAAYEEIDKVFKLSLDKKLSLRKKAGQADGYSGAHAHRYSSKLPWKETFSFEYYENDDSQDPVVVDYFKSILGKEFEQTGLVYQEYCGALKKLSLAIFELLGISLGLDPLYFKKFFEDSSSIMRCNYYPPCNNSGLTLGTGPHCDPISLTILHQDDVGGLEVFVDNKWQTVRPRPDSFVINIGDTFMALSNGKYKSCLHRAVVNRVQERRSLVFFVSPKEDKVVRPPQEIVSSEEPRKYPDFTWSDLFEFTQKHYRADTATLPNFFQWLHSSKPSDVTYSFS